MLVNLTSVLTVFHGHALLEKNLSHSVLSWSQTRWYFAFLFQPSFYKQMSFCSLIVPCFPHFLRFGWWFHYLKRKHNGHVFLIVFLSIRRLWYALKRKYLCLIRFIQISSIVQLAANSVLINQLCGIFSWKMHIMKKLWVSKYFYIKINVSFHSVFP